MVFTNLATGTQTLQVTAADGFGNTSAAGQAALSTAQYTTLGLYHLDDASPTADHSSANLAINTNTTLTGTGKWQQGRTFATTGTRYAAVNHNAIQNYGVGNSMSVEAYIYPTSAVSAANTYILNKSGSSSNYGWYLAYRGSGSTMNLVFGASLDGTTAPTQVLSPATCTFATNTWTHVAAVWNNGTIKFYCDGVYKGMGFLGVYGTASIASSTSTLDIGVNQAVTPVYFNGVIDEVRISQFPRDVGTSFPVPAIPYHPD
jgi:hypothetical protein